MQRETPKERILRLSQKISESFKIPSVLSLLTLGEKQIDERIEGRNIIIIIGWTQVGKSTTINSIYGVPFKYDDDYNVVPENINDLIAPVGSYENGYRSCTALPQLYISERRPEYCFLDTQGFNDTERNEDLETAAAIMLEMAIKKANSVRLMCVVSYSNISGQYSTFEPIGKILDSIISRQDVPVYFLFNRYTPPEPAYQKYMQIYKDYNKRHEFILNDIRSKMNNMITAVNNDMERNKGTIDNLFDLIDNNLKSVNENNGINENSLNELVKNSKELSVFDMKYKYVKLFEYSLENNLIGYIDPLNRDSIEKLKNDLINIPEFPKNAMRYSNYTNARTKFERLFNRALIEQNKFLKQYNFAKNYTPDYFQLKVNDINNNYSAFDIQLRNVKFNNNEREREEIIRQYSDRQSNARINELQQKINECNQLIIEAQNSISNFRKKPLKLFHRIEFNKKWRLLFMFRREYIVNIKNTCKIPIARVEEILNEGTKLKKRLYTEGDLMYYAKFKSDAFNDCSGQIKFYCKEEDFDNSLIKFKEAEIEGYQWSIEAYNKIIEEYRNINIQNIQEKLESSINKEENKKIKINQINEFVKNVKNKWNENIEGIKFSDVNQLYLKIIDKLYSNKQNNDTIKEFIRLSNEAQEAPSLLKQIHNVNELILQYQRIPNSSIIQVNSTQPNNNIHDINNLLEELRRTI